MFCEILHGDCCSSGRQFLLNQYFRLDIIQSYVIVEEKKGLQNITVYIRYLEIKRKEEQKKLKLK